MSTPRWYQQWSDNGLTLNEWLPDRMMKQIASAYIQYPSEGKCIWAEFRNVYNVMIVDKLWVINQTRLQCISFISSNLHHIENLPLVEFLPQGCDYFNKPVRCNTFKQEAVHTKKTCCKTYLIRHNIRRTKSEILTDSCLVVQLSLPNSLKPGVKSRMKIYLGQRRQATLQLHLSDQQIYCQLRCDSY